MLVSHTQLLTSEVRHAFGKNRRGMAGRVVSGILKSLVKSGRIGCVRSCGRSTASVMYDMTPEQFKEVQEQTIARAI
jgi:hypothetical protein